MSLPVAENNSSVMFNLPRLTFALCALQVLLYIIGFIMRMISTGPTDLLWAGLAFYPGLITYFWTLLIAPFFQGSLLELIGSVLLMAGTGRYFEEKAWNTREFLRFTVLCAVVPTFCTFTMYMAWFVASQDAYYLYDVPIHGISGLLGAYLVAFKQIIPEHTMHLFQGLLSVRVKHLPVVFVGISLALTLTIHPSIAPFLLAGFGSLTGWAYLRFYKLHDNMRGDRSETFAFISFFPEFLHWLLRPMSDFVYGLALLFRLVPPVVGGDLESSPMKSAHNSNNPELIEAERRRALALRALEERLQQQHQNSPQLSRQGPDAVPNNNNTAVV